MISLNHKGQSLVEAVLALGVISIIIGAVAIAVVTSLDNATFAKNQNLATQYAQQGIDLLRQQSEADWSGFYNACTLISPSSCTYCLAGGVTAITSSLPTSCTTANITSNGNFIRKVNISAGASGCTSVAGAEKISVSVAWNDGKCGASPYCHNVTLDTCIAQINNVIGP